MSKQIKSDHEVIEIIKAYRKKNPDATFQRIFKAAGIGERRLKDLIARKLVEPPAPPKVGGGWRSFTVGRK